MRLILLLLLATAAWANPILSFVTTGSASPNSVYAAWITDISSSHLLKWSTTSGVYSGACESATPRTCGTATRSGSVPWATPHNVVADGVPAGTIYITPCSTNPVEVCDPEQSTTVASTGLLAAPTAPTLADTSWGAGTGSMVTVGPNCADPVDGLEALWNAATSNTKIVIPRTTIDCTAGMRLIIPDGVENVLVTNDCPATPPALTRDSSANCHSFLYKAFFNYFDTDAATVNALTGNASMAVYLPGSFVYEAGTVNWNMKKSALDGVIVAVTAASNTTPIVITAAGHGKSNGQTLCVDGVLGNYAANGCFVAANVSGANVTLMWPTFSAGMLVPVNTIGSGAYTSGGQLQGLTWQTVTAVPNAGPLSGTSPTCPTPGAFGHDTTAVPFAAYGMYRCDSSLRWYKIANKTLLGVDTDGHDFEAVINAQVGAAKWRFQGLSFADVPIPLEPEYRYGPRLTPGIAASRGVKLGLIYNGWRDTDRIDFNQNIAPSDLSGYYVPTLWAGYTTNWSIRYNGTINCSGPTNVYSQDLEMGCAAIDAGSSLGPVSVIGNEFEVGGWCFFDQENGTWVINADITFDMNSCSGVPQYSYGTALYSIPIPATGPITVRTRQLVEFKPVGKRLRVRGNILSNNPISVSGSAAGVTVGTQVGYATTGPGLSVSAGGVVSVNAQRPKPSSLVANQKMMLLDGSNLGWGIYKIASIVANVITLKDLNDGAYSGGAKTLGSMCVIDSAPSSDIDISNNTFTNMNFMVSVFGTNYEAPYICQPAPLTRIRIANNTGYLWKLGQIGGIYGLNTAAGGAGIISAGGLVDNLQVINNTVQLSPGTTSNITGFAGIDNPLTLGGTNLLATGNILVANDFGIGGSGIYGTTFLGQRWPLDYSFTGNALVDGSSSGNPTGNVYPATAAVKLLASGQLQYSSPYLHLGMNIADLQRAQGLLTNPRVTVDADSVIVKFTSPVEGQHWYAEISSDGATWTRTTSTGSGFEQSADVPAATGVAYDVRMIGPQGATALGRFRTH